MYFTVNLHSLKDWHSYLCTSGGTFLQLLALVAPPPLIKKRVMRKPIQHHIRFTGTWRFLAGGRRCDDLKFLETSWSPTNFNKS